ncbi:MAG: YggS family pyridoxal phosphate-dependent enzyme [Clostridiales bacterium]|nr:YggS family pyridoxal phosphate-dependent enzyme [Clostridiales bacterium]
MTTDELKRNVERVRSNIERAAIRNGSRVELVAAVKTVPPDVINLAASFGITDVGENRVQEYVAKKDDVQGVKWHFIGTLQRNKEKYLVGNVALIQSVNCAELAAEIDRLAGKRGIVQDVLIEVNAAGESSKTGAPICVADELIGYAQSLNNLRVRGLMSVPPKGADTSVYERLFALYSGHARGAFDVLSVGMSEDYEKAIDCGSNMVRLGTAIFGRRVQ